ncbi:restriction endonuclease subunit S [Pseudomonas sp. S3_H04]
MSSEWQTVRVEDIAALRPGAMATGPFGSSISAKYFKSTGIPVIRGSNLSSDVQTKLDDSGLVFISEEKAREFDRCLVRAGDLIFTCWGTINQVGLIDQSASFERYIISNKQMKLTVDVQRVDSRFIYYVFSGPVKQSEILDNGIGSSVPGFNLGQLRKHEILLPPLHMQRAIADTLDLFTNRITLLRETSKTLQAIAQALFKSWFVDFEPVQAKSEGLDPLNIRSATAELFPDSFEETILGKVPRGWRLVPFGELLSHTIGGDWGDEVPSEKNDTRVAIIRGTDIPDLRSGAASRVPIRYTSVKKLATRALQDGDLLVEVSGGSRDQPTGRALYLTDDLLGEFDCPVEPASFCRLFRPVDRHTGFLLAQHLAYIYSIGKTWEYQNQSTGIANFQTTYFLKNELVAMPPSSVLAAFAEIIHPIANRAHLTQIRALTQLRDALLPRLISGQLRLSDTQKLIEEACA